MNPKHSVNSQGIAWPISSTKRASTPPCDDLKFRNDLSRIGPMPWATSVEPKTVYGWRPQEVAPRNLWAASVLPTFRLVSVNCYQSGVFAEVRLHPTRPTSSTSSATMNSKAGSNRKRLKSL